jgi:hypothetical protein
MANEFKIKKGLIVEGASGGVVVNVLGSQGQLLSVTDNLSGSIFAVSDISGVPIFDVNSSGLVTVDGPFTQTGGGDSNFSGDIILQNSTPKISLIDTDAGDSFSVNNFTGNFVIKNDTDNIDSLIINGANNATFAGTIGSGSITSTGIITAATTFKTDSGSMLFFVPNVGQAFEIAQNTGDATFTTQAFATVATSSGDASSTLTTKGYVDGLITGATIYRGTWDPDASLNSGYGNPNLNTVTQTSGYYYICSADGAATPNGATTEPNTWNTGDWVIWNDDIGTSGEWQKIDNSSVLSGAGTGQTVALWQGASSVTDSETLGNSIIKQNNSNINIGSTTTASNVALNVLSNDSHNAEINAYGNSQGTGVHYVGQSADYGGGIAYNGDGSPSYGNFGTDRVTLFRRENGTSTKVIDWSYGNSNPKFYGSASFENGVAFSSAASIRQQSDILILTGGGNGFAFNDDTNAVSNLLITAGGEATFSSTVKASTYLVNLTSAAGIGASLGDINGSELGPGYLTVSRDDTANAKQISFYKNNVEHSYLETTTSGLNIGGANVGIGTTSPSQSLHVVGNIKAFGHIFLQSNANGFRTVAMDTTDGADNQELYLCGGGTASSTRGGQVGVYGNEVSSTGGSVVIVAGNVSTGDIDFLTANTQRMIINNAGNVGIGTTSPLFKLQTNATITGGWLGYLNGTSATFGTNNFSAVHNSTAIGTGTESGINLANNASDVGAPSPIISFSAKSASGSYQHAYAAIYGIKTATGADTNWNKGDLVFATGSSTGPNERIRVTSAGNVGIGVTNPGIKLQVLSASEQLTNFSSSVADQLAYSQINASSSTTGTITAAAALELVGQANASGHGRHAWIGAEGTPNTTFETKLKFKIRGAAGGYDWSGSAEAPTIMTLEGTGNVGVGTTGPQSKLQVAGGIQMANDTDTASAAKVGTMRYRTATNEPVPVTGTELVTNGDLASSTGWNLQNSASINNTTGVATVPGAGSLTSTGGNWSLYQSNVMAPNKTYMLRFQARRDAGPNANMYAGWAYTNQFNQTVTAAWVQYQVVFTTGTQTWNELTFGGVTGTTFEVKDITVVEVTEEDASYADMCMQTGASTYEWVNIVRNTY